MKRIFSPIFQGIKNRSQFHPLQHVIPARLPPPKTPLPLQSLLRQTPLRRPLLIPPSSGTPVPPATITIQGHNDMLLIDVNANDLHEEISKRLEIKYLSDSLPIHASDVRGTVFGRNSRIFLSMTLEMQEKVKNIHFLLDTGSPLTFLSQEVLNSFGVETPDRPLRVRINNHLTTASLSPATSHYPDINILGTGYLVDIDAELTVNFKRNNVSLTFNPSRGNK